MPELPPLPVGAYLLEIVNGNSPKRQDKFAVTLGEVGPTGDTGAAGPVQALGQRGRVQPQEGGEVRLGSQANKEGAVTASIRRGGHGG